MVAGCRALRRSGMKNAWMIVALACVAVLAGYGGSLLSGLMQPQVVSAQNERATKGIRIAIVNIEKAAKASAEFERKQTQWERAREDLALERQRIEAEANSASADLRKARLDGDQDKVLDIQAKLETLEAKFKMSVEQHEEYLTGLMAKYQDDDLRRVEAEVAKVAGLQGVDIVLQDYDVDSASQGGFFYDGSYAQTLFDKQVFLVPGSMDNSNNYVTGIT